jgi:hypothetical protein
MGTPLHNRVWFLTWTTYGTWLPGDERGFVSPKFDMPRAEERHNKIQTDYDRSHADLRAAAEMKLVQDEVYLTRENAVGLWEQFQETARFRHWQIEAAAIMRAHFILS